MIVASSSSTICITATDTVPHDGSFLWAARTQKIVLFLHDDRGEGRWLEAGSTARTLKGSVEFSDHVLPDAGVVDGLRHVNV